MIVHSPLKNATLRCYTHSQSLFFDLKRKPTRIAITPVTLAELATMTLTERTHITLAATPGMYVC